MKRIVVLANYAFGIYKQRAEVFEELIKKGYEIYICTPKSTTPNGFKKMGCKIIDTSVDRRGKNLFKDFLLFLRYFRILQKIKPNIVLTYSIKPNIYGGLACRIMNVEVLHTVTGLGSVFIRKMKIERMVTFLNRVAFKKSTVFFLNNDNKNFYLKRRIVDSNNILNVVPGSGVNLNKFEFSKMPEHVTIIFSFIGRIFKDKGIEEFLLACRALKKKYENVVFNVVGMIDDSDYKNLIEGAVNDEIISYHGIVKDVVSILSKSHCIVLPSYGEGRGTVLQEGAAMGRIIITTNVYGCKDNVIEDYNGYLCEVGDWKSLADNMERVITMTPEKRQEMGQNSNKIAVKEFDRKIVVKEYMDAIDCICEM